MKTKIVLLAIFGFSLLSVSYGDIVLPNTHKVNYCPKIINLDKYPEISLIGYVIDGGGFNYSYLISDTICLEQGPNIMNRFILCAVSEIYMEYINNEIDKIDWTKNKNAYHTSVIQPFSKYYVNDTNPLISIDLYYKLMGFTDSSIIVYKCKEVFGFNNGAPDSVTYYNFDGDSTKLSQQVRSNIIMSDGKSFNYIDLGTTISPNPVNKNLEISLANRFTGYFDFCLFTTEGKLVYSRNLNKTAELLSLKIPVNNLTKGNYFLRITHGEIIESKKVIIN
jgi:hypothetical protein